MAATGILTWLTYAAIVAMIVAYALERWSIEVVSLSVARRLAGAVLAGAHADRRQEPARPR